MTRDRHEERRECDRQGLRDDPADDRVDPADGLPLRDDEIHDSQRYRIRRRNAAGDVVGLTFCPVCGGSHAKPQDCPGELRATGPERHGWRVTVETPFGIEAYGVLVAPSFDLWRSRIMTYPNVLWTVPGGAVTVKFAGRSPQDAEAQAVAFVEAHIKARGYVRRDGLDLPAVSRIEARPRRKRRRPRAPRSADARAARSIRDGAGAVRRDDRQPLGGGLFVMTLVPFDPGTDLRVLIDLETGRMGLKGRSCGNASASSWGVRSGWGQLIAPRSRTVNSCWSPDPKRSRLAGSIR